jgi:hypothetical protein
LQGVSLTGMGGQLRRNKHLGAKEEKLKPDASKCMSNALTIAQQLLFNGKQDGLNEFVEKYMNQKDHIDKYVKEMKAFIGTVPFLIMNWHK